MQAQPAPTKRKTHKTEYVARYYARLRELGIKRVALLISEEDEERFRELARKSVATIERSHGNAGRRGGRGKAERDEAGAPT